MAVYKETFYRGVRVWRKKLKPGEGIREETRMCAVYSENEVPHSGEQITRIVYDVNSERSVLMRKKTVFISGNTFIQEKPEEAGLAVDEGINTLPALSKKQNSQVRYKLQFKPEPSE